MKLLLVTSAFLVFLGSIRLGKLEEVPAAKSTKQKDVTSGNKFGQFMSCACQESYDPVCASDGYTYPNRCALNCARKAYPKLLGECAGECPCCRPAYQNDPIDQLTGTGSQTSGWGPGWGWGPLRPPPPRPPGRPVPYGRPPQPGRPVSSNRPPPASSGGVVYNGGGGPAMGGPYYSHFGGRYSHFRTGGLADEEFEEEAEMEGTDKRGDAESIEIEGKVKMEETDENSKTENREKHNMEVAMKKTEEKDKSDDVKLGFAPSFGAGWAGGACFCTSVYKPICGSNNVTYTNMCEFRCASRKNTCLAEACQGECPCCACTRAIVYPPPT